MKECIIRRIIGILKYPLFISLVLCIMLLFYLSKHGFPKWVVREIEKKIQQQDLVFTIEHIKFGIFQGVVLENVRCYVKEDTTDYIFNLEKLLLNIRPIWSSEKVDHFSYHFVLQNGVVFMPLYKLDNIRYKPSDKDMFIVLTNFYSELFYEPKARLLRCSSLLFSGHGLNVRASGECLLPLRAKCSSSLPSSITNNGPLSPPSPVQEYKSIEIASYVKTGLEFISYLTNSASSLNANINFYFDCVDPQKNTIGLTFVAKNLGYHNLSAQSCVLKGSLLNQQKMINLLINKGKIIDLVLDNITVRGCISETNFFAEEVVCIADTNRPEDIIKGKFNLTFNKNFLFRGDFYGEFQPTKLNGIFKGRVFSNIVNSLYFEIDPPSFKTHLMVDIGSNIISELNGEIQADHIVFHGVTNDFLNAKIQLLASDDHIKSIFLKRFLIVRENQIASGTIHIVPEKGTMDFSFNSSLPPCAILTMILGTNFNMADTIIVELPFTINGVGTLDYLHYQNNNIDFSIEARKITLFKLPFENCLFQAHIQGNTIFLSSVEATCCRGMLKSSSEITFTNTLAIFSFEASLHDVDCKDFVRHIFSRQQNVLTCGRLNGEISLSGNLDSYQSFVGNGYFTIQKSDILKIPLFTGFFQYVGNIIPGVKNLFQESNMEASFSIADGKFLFRNIAIDGDIFSLRAVGTIYTDGKLDFNVQLTLLKKETLVGAIVQFALTPLSKALEFKLEGSLEEPIWRPIFVPKELLSRSE